MKFNADTPGRYGEKTVAQLRQVIYDNGDYFKKNFDGWLTDNHLIFRAIVQRTWKAKYVEKRLRYGIRPIWEDVRRDTPLAEKEGQYKLTDRWHPDVARLVMLAYPQFEGFFELREGGRNESLLGCYKPAKAA